LSRIVFYDSCFVSFYRAHPLVDTVTDRTYCVKTLRNVDMGQWQTFVNRLLIFVNFKTEFLD
jgi:hypothetical protein